MGASTSHEGDEIELADDTQARGTLGHTHFQGKNALNFRGESARDT